MGNENKKGRKAKKTDRNNIFAVRLRSLIEETNSKQQDVAESIGVSRQALNKWTNGETVPDIFSASKIANYFNVSTDYMVGRSGTKSINDKTKAACEITGLSEHTIEHLTSNNYTYFQGYLNAFLSNLPIHELFDTLEKYITAENVIRHKKYSDSISLPDISKPPTKERIEERHAISLLEDYGYIILQSDFDILEFYEQKLNNLVVDFLKTVSKEATDNAQHNPKEE